MLSAYALSVFHAELTISELTSKQAFYPKGNGTGATSPRVPY